MPPFNAYSGFNSRIASRATSPLDSPRMIGGSRSPSISRSPSVSSLSSYSRSPSYSPYDRSYSPPSPYYWMGRSRSWSRSRSSSCWSSSSSNSPFSEFEDDEQLPDLNFDVSINTRRNRIRYRDDSDDSLLGGISRGRSHSLSSGSERSSSSRKCSLSCSPTLSYTISRSINYDIEFPPL